MVLVRHKLTLLEDRESEAATRWLSQQAKRLGVAQHVYVVGGAVRDFVLKTPTKDIDMVIDSLALRGRDSEWLAKRLARAIPVDTKVVTNNYGVALLTIHGDWILDGVNMRGEVLEIANAREESYGKKIGTIEADIKRREFTFNTLMWRLSDLARGADKAEIIDLTGCGLDDLKKGVMRCPSDPDKTFADDPTRMLRAIKFLVRYNFKIPESVARSVRKNASRLRDIPHGAIATLLTQQILKPGKIDMAFRELDRLGLTKVISGIMVSKAAFHKTMSNWATTKGVRFTLDLIRRGFPLKSPISFLTAQQQRQFQEAVFAMTSKDQDKFLAVLRQPGLAAKDKRFMSSIATGPMSKFAKRFMKAARQLLLDDPGLASQPAKFRNKIVEMGL